MKRILVAVACLVCNLGSAHAGPGYEQSRAELEEVMTDLIAWIPGSWDSFPLIYYENTVAVPEEGDHEHWHRIFERIDAPHIGDVVFYGQINITGRNGDIIPRSQVLYKADIDEELGAVNIIGRPILDADLFENLHDRPDLWGEVQMMDPAAYNCDWLFRRDGTQIFGVLQGKTPDRQKYGPGTCAFISTNTDEEFKADAEWVTTPEEIWIYDNNWMAGMLFLGREDRVHNRLYRARPYACTIKDADGTRTVDAHDRGHPIDVKSTDGQGLNAMLLRALYPTERGSGLDDISRLMVTEDIEGQPLAHTDEEPKTDEIELDTRGISISCERQEKFPSMHTGD